MLGVAGQRRYFFLLGASKFRTVKTVKSSCNRAILNWAPRGFSWLLWSCTSLLFDWLNICLPVSRPIRSKGKTKMNLPGKSFWEDCNFLTFVRHGSLGFVIVFWLSLHLPTGSWQSLWIALSNFKLPVSSGEFRWCNCGYWKLLCSLSYHSTPVWTCSSRRNLTSSAGIWALQWRIPSCQLWAGHGTTCTSSSSKCIRALLL